MINKLMQIVVYLLPYALIPLTFKFAGGIFSNITGMVNDKSKGLFDRAKANRQPKLGKLKSGDLPGLLGGKKFGAVTSGIASGPRGWRKGRAGMGSYRDEQRLITGQAAAEANQTWQAHKMDDKFHTAYANKSVAEGHRDEALRKAQNELAKGTPEGVAKAAQHNATAQAWSSALVTASRVPKNAALQLQSAQAWAQSGFNLDTGEAGYKQLSDTMAGITGAKVTHNPDGTTTVSGAGAGAYRNAMNNAQFGLKGAGRFDLAGINDGAGYDFEKGVDKASGYTAGNAKPDTHVAGGQDLVAGYSGSGKVDDGTDAGTTLYDALSSGISSGNISTAKVIAHHARLLDALPGATGGNKKEIRDQLEAIKAASSTNNTVSAGIQQNEQEIRLRGIDPSEIET